MSAMPYTSMHNCPIYTEELCYDALTPTPNKWSFLKSLKWDYCQDKPTQWPTMM